MLNCIGGENWSTRKKPPTCCKSLKNYITYICIEYISPLSELELTTLVVIRTDCIGSCKSNYHHDHDDLSAFVLRPYSWNLILVQCTFHRLLNWWNFNFSITGCNIIHLFRKALISVINVNNYRCTKYTNTNVCVQNINTFQIGSKSNTTGANSGAGTQRSSCCSISSFLCSVL